MSRNFMQTGLKTAIARCTSDFYFLEKTSMLLFHLFLAT